MAFAKFTQARHPLFPAFAGALTTLQTPLRPRPLDRNRGLHYRDPGISPDRTPTGWLPRTWRPVTS